MLRYSFPKLFVLACLSLFLVLVGCDQQPAMQEETTTSETSPETISERTKTLNAALDAMAKDVASALKHREVRTLIKEETSELLAGEPNVLFKTIASQEVQRQAKAKEATTFEQVLARQRAGSAKSDKAMKRALSSVRKDAKAIPKFDIGVPVRHEDWNAEEQTPLVAFHHRQEIDDTELERVKAYDAEGTVHWLDAQEAPDQPVVVVGINERTDAEGNVLPEYGDAESKNQRVCLKESSVKCGGGGGGVGGGGVGGGGSGSGGYETSSRDSGDKQYIAKFAVIDDQEPWLKEPADIDLKVKCENDPNNLIWEGTLDETDDGSSLDQRDKYLFRWHKSDYGDYCGFDWRERDGGTTFTASPSIFEFEWTDNDDNLGFSTVNWKDKWNDDPYNTGYVKWKVRWK